MKKRLLALVLALTLLPAWALAAGNDGANGDWSAKSLVLRNTPEAELTVRVGDIDALNEADAIENGYDPFTATSQRSHDYPWEKDPGDPAGTDSIFVGSHWSGEASDGYSSNFSMYKDGDEELGGYAFTDGALTIAMSYDPVSAVKNALLQLCIDDFQALSRDSSFSVQINGRDAPFLAELLNQVDQTGPTSYITSAILPPSFYPDVASGQLIVTVDELTGMGDGFAVDFARLLVNYNDRLFTGSFVGRTEPGATVRLLGTSTTVTASATGGFEFEAIPGLNAVRASKDGFREGYSFGIVFASHVSLGEDDEKWTPQIDLEPGAGSPDIDFSQFGATNAWENASSWAESELADADRLGLIPDSLKGQDLTLPITRAEFAAVSVKTYEAITGTKAAPAAVNPFTDCADPEVLKAYNVGVTTGTGDGTAFSPDVLLNREQALLIAARMVKNLG